MHKPTIYEVLRDTLGREPTNAELNIEVRRILAEVRVGCEKTLTGAGGKGSGRSIPTSPVPSSKSTLQPR